MKKQIRQQVYETNSSSTHSISIAESDKEFVMDTSLIPDQDGHIILDGGQFGWEWEKYNDALTKANYVSVLLMHLKVDAERYIKNGEESYDLPKWANNNYSMCLENFTSAIKEQTGCNDIICNACDNYESRTHSYIDHQSCEDVRDNEWLLDKEDIRKFIFNKNSWLFTGNDNSTSDPVFYDVPEFKEGIVINPRYKYELKINGYDKITKFKDSPSKEEITNGIESLVGDVRLYSEGGLYFDDDNSFEAQISRDDSKSFKYASYKMPIDFENKTIYFIREAWAEAAKIHKIKYPNVDWGGKDGYDKCRAIEEELYVNSKSKYVREVQFSLVEL